MRHKLRKSLAARGVIATAAKLVRRGLRPPSRSFDQPKQFAAVHPFDQQFGVETSGLLFAEDLPSGKRKDLYNTGYFGVPPSVFRQVLNRLDLKFEDYTFIDLGSGKGRALLLASEYPFRAIAGVELSPKLHAIAVANIGSYRGSEQRCRNIRSIEADATEFRFPAGPLLVYLWNPFEDPVFSGVLANLEEALAQEPREIYIVYIQPDQEAHIEASSCWRRLWREALAMSPEDYAAHAFPPVAEICSVYLSARPPHTTSPGG